jgi:hypothetical protein
MNESRHIYVEAPNEVTLADSDERSSWNSVFLAGGITGCPDWQKEVRYLLSASGLIIFNPRRASFDVNATPSHEQIKWEYEKLNAADCILFWFPAGASLCPIALYELGTWTQHVTMTGKRKPIFIGIEPGYKREEDIRVQTELTRPGVPIVSTLYDLSVLVAQEVGELGS